MIREIGEVDGKTLVESDWQGVQSYFLSSRLGQGSSRQQSFHMPKDANTVRIVLVGESAIKGFPQPEPLSAGAFLKVMLEDLWSDRSVEIINLGTTAVASFPVLDMVKQIIPYDPDLLVIYTGNNEFFGSYGVASMHSAGRSPWTLKLAHFIHGLGLSQLISARLPKPAPAEGKILMELMIRETRIDPDSPLRKRAAKNLEYHTGRMADVAQKKGVPVMICNLAANMRDLAPIGGYPPSVLQSPSFTIITSTLDRVRTSVTQQPAEALSILAPLISAYPDCALMHFLQGKALSALERGIEPADAFTRAIDLDTLPWRATTRQNEALYRAANRTGAMFCDVNETFRAMSRHRSTGWPLMDDHVHPSLAGQALLAQAIIGTLREAPPRVRVPADALQRLKPWTTYAGELGANPYEKFGSALTMLNLFDADFLRTSNPEAWQHAKEHVQEAFTNLPADVAKDFESSLKQSVAQGGGRSVSAVAGYTLVQRQRFDEAEQLFEFAARCMPLYSSDRREFAYMKMVCRMQKTGQLSSSDREEIRREIELAKTRLAYGNDPAGKTHFFLGKLYELIGEHARSATHLEQARVIAEKQAAPRPFPR